jgi:hypothetical protein
MKTKDLLTIGTAALGTATLTVLFLATPRMTGTDTNPTAATIAQPKFAANGIEVTLSAANGRKFSAGDQPEFELRAVNTLNEPAQVAVCATLYSLSPGGAMSRIGPMPAILWHQDIEIALKPNETRVLALDARTNLPANREISVSLSQVSQAGKTTVAGNPGNPAAAFLLQGRVPGIVALRFSTAPPKSAPTVASATSAGPAAFAALR